MTKRLLDLALVAACGLLFAGCPRPGHDTDADQVPADTAAADAGEPGAEAAVCLRGSPFVGDGALDVRDAAPADADRVGAIRWEAHEGCERLVIDFLDADGNAARRAGDVTAEVIRDLGVVRLDLRDVEWVEADATDGVFDGPLARRAYAVFSPEGRWVFVDVHLGDAAEAFVATLDDPARVVVDLRPDGGAVPAPAPRESRVVVLEPRPGDSSYPLTVSGYARTFEANVVVRLERDGEDAYDDFTTATAWVDAWGHYTFTIEDGPTGPVTLHVGEHSARDGTWEGVAVELRMR
jgi:hypothetical protein